MITNKLSNTMLIRSAEYFERNFTQEAKKEQFCVSKEQKIPKGYAIHFNDGKQTYSKNGDWKPGTYYVTKGYSILRTNFGTKEAALKWVQELAKGRNKTERSVLSLHSLPMSNVPDRIIGMAWRSPDSIILIPLGSAAVSLETG